MTVLDWSVIGVVAVSMLVAFARGITRELIALLAWVLGFFAAVGAGSLAGAVVTASGLVVSAFGDSAFGSGFAGSDFTASGFAGSGRASLFGGEDLIGALLLARSVD